MNLVNNGPGLSMTNFTTKKNLAIFAFKWEIFFVKVIKLKGVQKSGN